MGRVTIDGATIPNKLARLKTLNNKAEFFYLDREKYFDHRPPGEHNLDRNLAELSSTSVLLLIANTFLPSGNQPHARRYEFTTYDVLEWYACDDDRVAKQEGYTTVFQSIVVSLPLSHVACRVR